MNSRMAKVEQTAGTTLRSAREFAVEQAAKVQHELQAEINTRTQALGENVNKLEASHQEESVRLQNELASVRAETRDELARSQQEAGRAIGDLQAEVGRNRDDLDVVARTVERQRLDFEIDRNETSEVAPGLTLTVSGTDVSYQRVEGRLHVISDGRILWIRGQGVHQPVRFYNSTEERPYEVVFTRVMRDAAVGYVLMPAPDQASDGFGESADTAYQPESGPEVTDEGLVRAQSLAGLE
jgi:hypothetical protein